MARDDAAAMESDYSDSEASEYGLKDLAKLPLLEQVHRLFHAIQRKYPYTETAAWKALPLDQKRLMLQYIRERRAKKDAAAATATATAAAVPAPAAHGPTAEAGAVAVAAAAVEPSARAAPSAGSAGVKTDPYLQMLQKRSLRTAPVAASGVSALSHPNSAYAAGQAQLLSQYVENTARRQAAAKSRWKVVDAEFYDDPPVCACGVTHEDTAASAAGGDKSEKGERALLVTMRAMLSTFGDHTRPCAATVKHVKAQVGAYLRERLSSLMEDGMVHAPCLRTFVEIFAEEAVYYGRWREFRGETKQQEPDLENVEEDELAEELDLFAVSEADAVFNETFLERIRFADERTRGMDWSIYDSFSKSRKLNFMSNRGAPFRQWLQLGSCSRASLEFMNFVSYHNIGRLVEMAIKQRTGGRLQALDSALLVADIDAVLETFRTEERYNPTPSHEGDEASAHNSEPPNKARRLDGNGSSAPSSAASALGTAATTSESSSSSSGSSESVETTSAAPQRLTRLKRLR